MAYITQLDAAKPVASDPVAEGAGEIRELKQTLKDTFPYANSPLNVSNAALNELATNTVLEMSQAIAELKARVEALESA